MTFRATLLSGLASLPLAGGCTTIRPVALPAEARDAASAFTHTDFDRVLARFVDTEGRVDYTALAADSADLDRYYARLAEASPDRSPERFPDEDARLAYWINAYNAAAIKAVLTHYPIASVRDVRPPRALFFLPRLSGFFLFQRIILGGKGMSLYALENQIIRKRFADPRIHFALNCASASCPTLPRRAFSAAGLDEELAREARDFVAQERNVHIDPGSGIISLSSIFKWYEGDFLSWQKHEKPGEEATLLAYISPLLPPDRAAVLRTCSECRVDFIPYDWQLNDRPHAAHVSPLEGQPKRSPLAWIIAARAVDSASYEELLDRDAPVGATLCLAPAQRSGGSGERPTRRGRRSVELPRVPGRARGSRVDEGARAAVTVLFSCSY